MIDKRQNAPTGLTWHERNLPVEQGSSRDEIRAIHDSLG